MQFPTSLMCARGNTGNTGKVYDFVGKFGLPVRVMTGNRAYAVENREEGMRIETEVEEIEMENDSGRTVDGLQVTCSRCQHAVEVYGTSDASARRGG